MQVDDDGVLGTLSFSRMPFTCSVPWDAVFALVGDDGRGMVWPESMPPEIAAEVDREALRAKRAGEGGSPGSRSDAPRERGAGRLRAVSRDEDAGEGGTPHSLWDELHKGEKPGTGDKSDARDKPSVREASKREAQLDAPSEHERDTDKLHSPWKDSRVTEGEREPSRPTRTAARSSSNPPSTASKARRSLPPYLRVVK